MVFIYILQLEEGKYYVGKSNNPEVRIEDHFSENGAEWTKKYKPLSVVKVIPDCDDYDEDKYTVQSMGDYGIDNVRGGSFCQTDLTDQNWSTLVHMIHRATNRCYNCGGGHYIKDCPKERPKEKNEHSIDIREDYVIPPIHKTQYKGYKEYYNEPCDCIASYFPHRRGKCLLNNFIALVEDEIDNKCYRCGRYGHYEKTCYARTHVKGYGL